MYTACIFCHASLGANEAIEHFPVGRRLAFDSAKGRLWVVCRKCERWNLTPLEERWEAIEECERAFSDTRLRVSTDNVGLARLREGIELVRIGKPMRPEFAAWRYGDQFGRRARTRMYYLGAVAAVGLGAAVATPLLVGTTIASAFSIFQLVHHGGELYAHRRVRARIPVSGGSGTVAVRRTDTKRILISTDGDRWALQFRARKGSPPLTVLEGDAALRAAAAILPIVNYNGASKKAVSNAVSLVDQYPDVNRLFLSATRRTWLVDPVSNRWVMRDKAGANAGVSLQDVPGETLLALEMATHEDVERRALDGELALLTDAWRQAEEIAKIADDLTLPEAASAELEKLKGSSARSDG
jgi:hypothetical protein